MRKIKQQVLALVLVMALSFSSIMVYGQGKVHAAEGGYQEYTFDEWGLTDGYVDNTGKLSGTAPSEVTSWDKVAVSGYAAFTGQGSILFDTIGNTDGGMRILYYGGSVSIGGKGITMYSDATCATSAGILTSGAIVAEGAEAYIRVELDVVATNVLKASLYVNDAEPVIGYYQLGSTNLKITMHGFATGDKVEWRSETEEIPEEPITYQEYTFDEWGLTDGYVDNTGKLSGTAPSEVTSWDKVAVSGYAAFTGQASILFDTIGNTDGGMRILYYGGSVSIGGKGITMYSDATCATSAGILTSSAIVAEGAEAYIRVELDVVATNVLKASLYVNDAEPVIGYYQLGSTNLKITMHGFATGDKVEWRSETEEIPEEPITYQKYTFDEWGLTDGYVDNTGKVSGTAPSGVTSWNKVAVSGYATFTGQGSILFDTAGNTDAGVRILYYGGSVSIGGKGITMYSDATCATGAGILTSSAIVAEGAEAYIRVELDVVATNVLKASLYVNDAEPVIGYYQLGSTNLKITMHGFATGDKVEWRSPAEISTEYAEYTFSNWELTDGYVDNTGKVSGTAPSGVTSWNKVAVSGYATFTGQGSILFDTAGNTDAGVRILYYGGSVSIGGKGITMYSDATCATGAGILTSSAIVAEGAEAYIRVELDVVATNVLKASLYVNDAEPVIGYYQLSSTNLKITMHGFATGDKVEWSSGVKRYADMSVYRRTGEYQAPELPGYVFSGWETLEGNAVDADTKSGFAYAKFVDEDVLSVRAQLTAGTTAESTTTDMRLVTSVDNLSYQEIGFDVSTPYGSLSHSMNTVYKEIVAQEGGVEFSYTPTVFSNSSTYFATFTITGLYVKGNTNVNFTVEPYWITADGTTVYGVTRNLTLAESF